MACPGIAKVLSHPPAVGLRYKQANSLSVPKSCLHAELLPRYPPGSSPKFPTARKDGNKWSGTGSMLTQADHWKLHSRNGTQVGTLGPKRPASQMAPFIISAGSLPKSLCMYKSCAHFLGPWSTDMFLLSPQQQVWLGWGWFHQGLPWGQARHNPTAECYLSGMYRTQDHHCEEMHILHLGLQLASTPIQNPHRQLQLHNHTHTALQNFHTVLSVSRFQSICLSTHEWLIIHDTIIYVAYSLSYIATSTHQILLSRSHKPWCVVVWVQLVCNNGIVIEWARLVLQSFYGLL